MCSNRPQVRALAAASFVLSLESMIQIATAAPPTDACALLSQSQVAAALGVEVDAGEHVLGTLACRWTERGKSPGSDVARLQIALATARSFEIGKTPIPQWSKTPVTGIGDDAYIVEKGKVTFPVDPTLSVKRGSAFFTISALIPKGSMEQTKALERTVALKIVEKL
jgi:hypothetical protein